MGGWRAPWGPIPPRPFQQVSSIGESTHTPIVRGGRIAELQAVMLASPAEILFSIGVVRVAVTGESTLRIASPNQVTLASAGVRQSEKLGSIGEMTGRVYSHA